MRYFPVKIVILCILLTPVLYTTTLGVVEDYLEGVYQQKVENRIIGDAAPLLDGRIDIEDAVSGNIHTFLNQDPLVQKIGVELDIVVSTAQGRMIYPYPSESVDIMASESEISADELIPNPTEIARRNFEVLNHGLQTKVQLYLRHGTVGANLILVIYLLLSLSLFLAFYYIGVNKARRHDMEKGERFTALLEEERGYREKLDALEQEREQMVENYETVKSNYQEKVRQAGITENDLFEEIVTLEKKLDENLDDQKQRQEEIELLREKLAKEERKKGSTKKRKIAEITEKRLATLYKNVDLNRKALAGLFDLSEEMQIKAEELIHQLNDEPSKVTIKRKVFAGKKNKTASFEVLFSYNGRLYFRNSEGNRIEVLVIGTKNSQDKDMEFLHDLG